MDLSELLNSLNSQQREAVLYDRSSQLIVAGAGTGKTRVIMTKIIYYAQKLGIDPNKILAITFTNKAAREMEYRLSPCGLKVNMGTFHAVGLRILRVHGDCIGIKSPVAVYDEQDQIRVVKEVMKELGIFHKDVGAGSFVEWISRRKDDLNISCEVQGGREYDYQRVFKMYQEKLLSYDALDFGDLITKPVELLEKNPDLQKYYQQRFSHIFVDEYQDTNKAQARLLELMVGENNVCVVGDPDQSIYGWRGASIENILEFDKKFPGTKIFKLEKNYRSTDKILQAANFLISANAQRYEKSLWTDNKAGDKICYHKVYSDKQEANKVADTIEKHHFQGKPYCEMAVFYRTHNLSRLLEDALISRAIPYLIVGGVPFYQRREIKDLIAYLRILVFSRDRISWLRVINVPPRGLGERSLNKISVLCDQNFDGDFLSALKEADNIKGLTRKAKEGCAFMVSLVEKYKVMIASSSWHDVLNGIVTETGYLHYLENTDVANKAQVRLENLMVFMKMLDDYQMENREAKIQDFLETVALHSSVDDLDGDEDRVSLMTLHCAKGLEFSVVCMVGMEENMLPYSKEGDSEDRIEEERRLCYVGMTRAKEKLYLFSSKRRFGYSEPIVAVPSRFIGEIPSDFMKTVKAGGNFNRRYMENLPASSDLYNKYIDEFLPGDYVSHYDLGKGRILGGSGTGKNKKLIIIFDGDKSPRTVMASYAGLSKLGGID